MSKLFTITAIALTLGVLAVATHLDNVSDEQVEKAVAADLQAARRDAMRMTLMVKRCHKEKGPSAEVIQIEGTDDYVCREGDVEPTPEHILRRYAELAGRKL